MDRNAVEGVSQAPRRLINLEPDRYGGYGLRGIPLQGSALDFRNFTHRFGYDHQGYSSWGNETAGTVTVRKSDGVERVRSISTADWEYGVHLPSAGYYNSFDKFYFYDADGTITYTRGGLFPKLTVSTSGGNIKTGHYAVYMVYFVKTKYSRLALMALRQFVNFTADGGKLAVSFSGDEPPSTHSIDIYVTQKIASGIVNDQTSNLRYFFAGTHRLLAGLSGTYEVDGSFPITDIPIGPELALNGYGVPVVASLTRPGYRGPVALHNGRLYFVPDNVVGNRSFLHVKGETTVITNPPNLDTTPNIVSTAETFTPLTLAWTEVNTLNLFNYLTSYQPISAENSEAITALSSTEDGLIIFCHNETFLMRGDPSYIAAGRYADFNITPLLSIGCDALVRPGELGPDTYPIYKGEVWRVSGGSAENISRPVYDRTDPFVQVVGEVERNCIVVRSTSGRTFYFYPEDNFWGESLSPVSHIVPNPYTRGTLYARVSAAGGDYMTKPGDVLAVSGTRSAAYTFEMDMGAKHVRKEGGFLRIPVSQGFAGTATLEYKADAGTPQTVGGKRKGDTLFFVLKRGTVGRLFTFTVTLTGMGDSDAIEPPVVAEYIRRGTRY